MGLRLLLAPAASGKTHYAVECINKVLEDKPLSPVWVVLPDRGQGAVFQRRLAVRGALGVRLGTFGDLYAEILAETGAPLPVTPEPVIHRLIRASLDRVAERGQLVHYRPILHRPGLASLLADLFAELRRGLATPSLFSAGTAGRAPRLQELALLYEEYQSCLLRLNWSDHEGLGWAAVSAVEANPSFARSWRLLVVDGFDSFNPTQLALLQLLSPRVGDMLVTLTGELAMSRIAYRRFARTYEKLMETLSPQVEELRPRANPVPALAHLEAQLFQPDPSPVPAGAAIGFVEAQTLALEAREALRWLKGRIVRDGVRPDQCCIVTRDIGLYRVFLREAAREFGLPLRLACGEPLISNPAIAALLGLLELPLKDWRRRPLLDALRSPYFDMSPFGLCQADAPRLEEVASAGQVLGGTEEWRQALALAASQKEPDHLDLEEDRPSPPRRPLGDSARTLWNGLEALFRRLTPPEQGSLAAYAGWVEELLVEQEGSGFLGCASAQQDTAVRDGAAIEAFATALGALVLGESVAGRAKEVGYGQFYSELRALVDSSSYRSVDAADPHLGRIYATDLSAARGVSYRAVALLGLSEGLFPAPLLSTPV